MSAPINRRPHILLGITGSVAAVKGPKLALRLAAEIKADVKVVLTRTVEHYFWKEGRAVSSYDVESWKEFQEAISPPDYEVDAAVDGESGGDWRSSNGSISLHYAEEEWDTYKSLRDSVLHIDLRNWADVCLIAPLSAHTLAKIANGLCDDLLTCILRAWDFGQRTCSNNGSESKVMGKPVILAPAMNTAMWEHPLTKVQLETVQKFATCTRDDKESKEGRSVVIVEPAVKTLACGDVGAGALAELDDVISSVEKCLVNWGIDACTETANKDNSKGSVNEKKESMRKALLLFAKQRFTEMKTTHGEQQPIGLSNTTSASKLVAPISPTPNLIIDAFLPRLNLDSNSFLVDLGCGDGRWLILANQRTCCECLGIDVDEERLRIAHDSIAKNNLQERIQVRKQDVFEFVKQSDDIDRANVIVVYLFREAMKEMALMLKQRLNNRIGDVSQKEMKILSVGFALPDWKSDCEEKVNGIRVYLYSISP